MGIFGKLKHAFSSAVSGIKKLHPLHLIGKLPFVGQGINKHIINPFEKAVVNPIESQAKHLIKPITDPVVSVVKAVEKPVSQTVEGVGKAFSAVKSEVKTLASIGGKFQNAVGGLFDFVSKPSGLIMVAGAGLAGVVILKK